MTSRKTYNPETTWKYKKHYRVYYILDATSKEIIYIGRTSRNPATRKLEHEKERGLPKDSVLGLCQRFWYAEDSKMAESRAIRKYQPKYNVMFKKKARKGHK